MKSFNLSEWALRHRSLVVFFMLDVRRRGHAPTSSSAAGGSGFHRQDHGGPDRLARAPPSSDTLEQVTDRIERKLEETPNLDYIKSYTSAGRRPRSSST